MTNPAYLAVCCLDSNVKTDFVNLGREILANGSAVSTISITLSIVALLSVGCLVIQRRIVANRDREAFVQAPSTSANWIIVSSSLTTFAILLRAVVWNAGFTPKAKGDAIPGPNSFCVVLSVTVEYFSTCLSFCYLVYGIEMYTGKQRQGRYRILDVILGWVIPVVICAIGAWAVYFRSLKNCYVMTSDGRIATYIILICPVLMVLILCPILLCKAAQSVKRNVRRRFGCYTGAERQIVTRVRARFLMLMLSYIVCWLPNLLGSVMVNAGDSSIRTPLEVLWSFTAVLNSIHCLLAMLVIHGWPFSCRRQQVFEDLDSQRVGDVGINRNPYSQTNSLNSSVESDPLLTDPLRT